MDVRTKNEVKTSMTQENDSDFSVDSIFGCKIFLRNGTVLYDAASGTFNVALGGGATPVIEAAKQQMDRACHVSSLLYSHEPRQLIKDLCQHAPSGIGTGKVRDATGSTANEGAIKAAQKVTGRNGIVTLFLSHHGQTALTTAISGLSRRKMGLSGLPIVDSVKVPAPYCLRCHYKSTYPSCGFHCVESIAEYMEFGSSGQIGCLIVEPVLGNGGNIVPPPGYHAALSEFCERNEIILIADEVQTGMGRTGAVFGSVLLGLRPNIITLAKGISGIGLPLAAMLYEADLDVLEPYEHSFTGGGNPVAVAAARATLRQIESPGFLDAVSAKGRYLKTKLEAICSQYPFVAEVRGIGLMIGVEFVKPDRYMTPDPDLTNQFVEVALVEHQLIVRSSQYGFGNVVKVRPCLTATQEELDQILDRFGAALNSVAVLRRAA
jgi:4-aminobutyrate aminotransferase